MNGSSRSESPTKIFRLEALAHRNRASMRQGDPLRLSAARLQCSVWVLVGVVAAGLALAARLEIDELASGPAVVRCESVARRDPQGRTADGRAASRWDQGGRTVEGRPEGPREQGGRGADGKPAASGGVPGSFLVVGYLPARDLSALRHGAKARFAFAEPDVTAEIALESVDPRPIAADVVRRLLNDPTTPSPGEAMVAVVGRLDPASSINRGQRLECREGLRGTIEVHLPPRTLVSALVRRSSVDSGSSSPSKRSALAGSDR